MGKKYMTDVRDMVDMSFLAVSGRSPVADKAMNGLTNGGLMSGSQILVNSAVKNGVTQ